MKTVSKEFQRFQFKLQGNNRNNDVRSCGKLLEGGSKAKSHTCPTDKQKKMNKKINETRLCVLKVQGESSHIATTLIPT